MLLNVHKLPFKYYFFKTYNGSYINNYHYLLKPTAFPIVTLNLSIQRFYLNKYFEEGKGLFIIF